MEQRPPAVSQKASEQWIAGRAQTLLSHYFHPNQPQDVQEAALSDWVRGLSGFSQGQIDGACQHYLRSQPSKRPTVADIRNRMGNGGPKDDPRSKLSADDLFRLDSEILPTARKWVRNHPNSNLADLGMQTLRHWGEQP